MQHERIFRLGHLHIDGHAIDFEAEPELAFEADRSDAVMIGVHYAYREASPDRERTRIRVTAHIEGQRPESYEAVIGDNPLFDDSRRGFVSVPVKVPGRGALKGRFVVEATYAVGPWRGPDEDESQERVEGEFTLHVK